MNHLLNYNFMIKKIIYFCILDYRRVKKKEYVVELKIITVNKRRNLSYLEHFFCLGLII